MEPTRNLAATSTRLDAVRRFYARIVTSSAGVNDARILEAFATVERERFTGPGPWQVPVATGYISTETDDPACDWTRACI